MCFSSGYTLGLGVGACPVGSLVGAYRLVHPGDGGYPVGTPVGDGYPIGADVGRYGSPDGAVVANVLVGRGTGCPDGWSVGRGTGWRVGRGLSSCGSPGADGMVVGAYDGNGDGARDGRLLGAYVGNGDGALEGRGLGAYDGNGVGAGVAPAAAAAMIVGSPVALRVGRGVRSSVGGAEGCGRVGNGVGE